MSDREPPPGASGRRSAAASSDREPGPPGASMRRSAAASRERPASVLLAERTSAQARAAIDAGAICVIPVGATEQHGDHLPLETDWRLCSAVAEGAATAATAAGTPVLVTPPIWTGYSPHHMAFPGSVTLSLETLLAVVGDVARSLWSHGARKIVLLNGHGGNAGPLRALVPRLRFEDGVRVAAVSYWDLALDELERWRRSGPGGIDHACEMETALMRAVRPELVREQGADRDASWFPRSPYLSGDLAIGAPVTVAWAFDELSADGSGTLGDPREATAERGAALLAVMRERLTAFLLDFATWNWDDPRSI